MPLKEIGVVIKLNESCVSTLAPIRAAIAERLGRDAPNNPHVTLYHLKCDENSVGDILMALNTLKIKPFEMHIKGPLYETAGRWIDLKATDEGVQAVHEQVVNALTPFKVDMLDRVREGYDAMPDATKARADTWGVPGVMDKYNPHTTLCYEDAVDSDALKAIVEALQPMADGLDITCSPFEIIVSTLDSILLYKISLFHSNPN